MPEILHETSDRNWKGMLRLGGICALAVTAFFLLDMVVLMALRPYPETASGWFLLLQNNRLAGLLSLDILVLAGFPLCYPLFLALYGALRRVNPVTAAFAAILAFAGLTMIITTDKIYALIALSNQFTVAATEAQKNIFLAAGEAALSAGSGTGATLGAFFLEGAALIVSVLMLRSGVFGRAASWTGIAGHGLDLIRISINLIFLLIGSLPFVATVGFILLAVGGTLQLVWYALVGIKLLQMGRG